MALASAFSDGTQGGKSFLLKHFDNSERSVRNYKTTVNLFQRSITTVLLGVYALTGTAAVPALAAFLACLDGGHNVAVSITQSGAHLSLKHQQSDITLAADEHHSAAGRLVTRFCRNNSAGTHEFDSQLLSPTISLDRELKKTQEHPPSPQFNHQASLVLEIIAPHTLCECRKSNRTLDAARHIIQPSLWPMTATVQLLL